MAAARPTFRIIHPTARGPQGTVTTDDGRPVKLTTDPDGVAEVDDLALAQRLVDGCGYCWDFAQDVAGHSFVDGHLVEDPEEEGAATTADPPKRTRKKPDPEAAATP